ncbi:MAG: DUF1259 domain-containing protein [Gammaproteobacteria bacterium]
MKPFRNGVTRTSAITLTCLLLATSAFAVDQPASTTKPVGLNPTKIERLSGLKGHFNKEENVFKIAVPRDDLKVNANGVQITADMGLTSWIAFKHVDKDTYLLGDLVLTPDQVNPVMGVALNNGVQITSLHNSYLWESPQVVFMHIEATGKQEHLADIAKRLFAAIKDSSGGKGELPLAMINPTETTLDAHKLNTWLGVDGKLKDGVYKFILGKTAETDDYPISGSMGLSSWASFAGTNTDAVVNGNFVVEQAHLQKVLISLHNSDIFVVGIQAHTADSEPKFVSVHFWGVGDTKTLAKGIRNAIEMQQSTTD